MLGGDTVPLVARAKIAIVIIIIFFLDWTNKIKVYLGSFKVFSLSVERRMRSNVFLLFPCCHCDTYHRFTHTPFVVYMQYGIL